MKKNLWYQLAIMMAVVLSIGLVACGGDDDDVNNSGSGNLSSKVSNSVLSSRLKDKNGNPVLLKGVGNGMGEWQVYCEYDENGALTYYESDGSKCNVDGMKIVATDMPGYGNHDYELQVTLNGNGLIATMVVSYKNYDKNDGYTLTKQEVQYSYNSQNQLVEYRAVNGISEKYDKNGNLLSKEELNDMTRTITWVDGNPGGYDVAKFGTEVNVTKQNIDSCTYFEGPNEALYMLGLFGVGPANFLDDSYRTPTLNENGTISTEGGSLYVYY